MPERLPPPLTASEEREVSRFMSDLSRTTLHAVPRLPPPAAVWLKAQLLRRWETERRVERPLDTMQSIHLGIGLVAALVLLVWSAPVLLGSFRVF